MTTIKSERTKHNSYTIEFDGLNDLQTIKLNNLRQKRRQMENKLQMVTNRIVYRKKRQEDELKRYLRSQEQNRTIYLSKSYKMAHKMLKHQNQEKNKFEIKKKAQIIENYRQTKNRRLSLIYQSVKDKKLQDSQKIRKSKKVTVDIKQSDESMIMLSKTQAINNAKEKHEQIIRMKQKQSAMKTIHLMQKKQSVKKKLAQEAEMYEKQIHLYNDRIQRIKQSEELLKYEEHQALRILRNAQQNLQILRSTH